MSNKGFITIEAIFYTVITLILTIILTTIILNNTKYSNNKNIKIYQSFDIMRKTLLKYRDVTTFNQKELIFDDKTKIRINNNEVYETPGYMPYFQKIKNAKFIYRSKQLILSLTYNKIKYEQVIFYDKY